MGTAMSAGESAVSRRSGRIPPSPGSQFMQPSIRLETTLFFSISPQRLRRSFHITNWPKENSPRYAASSTFHRRCAITACLTVWNTRRRSTP